MGRPMGWPIPTVLTPMKGTGQLPGKEQHALERPENDDAKLSVPRTKQIEDATIGRAAGTDERPYRGRAHVYPKATGSPWEVESDVCVAGHHVWLAGTNPNPAPYDLDGPDDGDVVLPDDARGRHRTREVFEKLLVEPTNSWAPKPIGSENIDGLRSHTSPDQARRLIGPHAEGFAMGKIPPRISAGPPIRGRTEAGR